MDIKRSIAHVYTAADAEIADALVESGLASSKTEARRLIKDNAIALNGVKVTREHFEPGDFQNGRLLMRKGNPFQSQRLSLLTHLITTTSHTRTCRTSSTSGFVAR